MLEMTFIFPPRHDKTQNSKQKEDSVQDFTVFVNDMAVMGFTMTKNDGTALSGNSLGSFHAACFLENRLFRHTNRVTTLEC